MPVSKLSDSLTANGSKRTYQSFLAGNAAQTPDAWDSISTTTLASSQTTITFEIPQTYGHLRFHILGKQDATASATWYNIRMNFNSDSGSNYTRQYNILEGKGSTPGTASTIGNTAAIVAGIPTSHTSLVSQFSFTMIDVFDYQMLNKFKTWKAFTTFDYNSTSPAFFGQSGGAWSNTNSITSISFTSESGNFATGSVFALYGLRG